MAKYIVDVSTQYSWTYEGPFIFQKVFNSFFDILREKGYKAPDVFLTDYSESINDDGTRTVKVTVKGKKSVSDYIKYEIKVKLSFENMKRIQKGNIDVDWGKVKLTWDTVAIEFDEDKRLKALASGSSLLSKIFSSIYEFVIIKGELDNHRKNLMNEIQYISNRLLEELNSYRFYRQKIEELEKEKNKNLS